MIARPRRQHSGSGGQKPPDRFSLVQALATEEKFAEEIAKKTRVIDYNRVKMLLCVEDLGGEKAGDVLKRERDAKKTEKK